MRRDGGRRVRGGRGRWLLVVSAVALALLGVAAAANGTLVYSQTPGQLAAVAAASPGDAQGQRVRVAGTVVPGTLVERAGTATFTLAGGGRELQVRCSQAPRGTFREGQQAVVEGSLQPDGTFAADQVMAKHANDYRAPSPTQQGAPTGPAR